MKKIITLIVFFVAGITIYAQQINDPNAELRPVTNFHGISVSSAFTIYLTQSNEYAVAVSAATAADRAMIKVDVKDGVLIIGLNKDWKWNKGNKKLKAYISFKDIDKLIVSGACDVITSGTIKLDRLKVNQSGASDFKGKLEVDKLTVDLSGASDMTVTGSATQLIVNASGASDFKGYNLTVDICDANASGASDIKVTVNKELSAQASGASDVKYKGNGLIREVKSSGSGKVSRG